MTLLPGLLLVSCRDSALETALRLAGDNRPELEAVCAQLGLTVEDLPARLWD